MKKYPKTISNKVVYEVPLVPINLEDIKENAVRVKCHAYEDDYGNVKVIADVDGYKPATFYSSYFTWLVQIGYIERLGDEKLVYKKVEDDA